MWFCTLEDAIALTIANLSSNEDTHNHYNDDDVNNDGSDGDYIHHIGFLSF